MTIAASAVKTIVLLVDDEVDEFLVSEAQLSGLSVIRRTVAGLSPAMGVLKAAPPDERFVIVLDVMFPDSGVDDVKRFVQSIRQLVLRGTLDACVIVNTALKDETTERELRAAGAIEYFVKGASSDELLVAVRESCGDETLVSSTLCEVIHIDGRVARVSVAAGEGWTAERSVDLDWCPATARFTGATFFAELFRRRNRNGNSERVFRSRVSETESDIRKLNELFERDTL